MAIDPVWAGVVGTAVGAVAGSATSLLAPLINWRTENKRLDKQHQQSLALLTEERQAELARICAQADADDRSVKREAIKSWRDGIAGLLADYKTFLRDENYYFEHRDEPDVVIPEQPSVGGQEWFETMRPNLWMAGTNFSEVETSPTTFFNELTAHALSQEVSRIEREWKLV